MNYHVLSGFQMGDVRELIGLFDPDDRAVDAHGSGDPAMGVETRLVLTHLCHLSSY